VPCASFELRWGRLSWAGGGSEIRAKPWLWSTSRREDIRLSSATNHRTREGEIDLVMRNEATLVFVEVKLRRGMGFGDPLEAVTPRKQASTDTHQRQL
jgi:Holliday junction resolvase-like predicted endonuclease